MKRRGLTPFSKREVIKAPDAAAKVDQEVTASTNGNEISAFTSWIAARTEAAQVEQLYKR